MTFLVTLYITLVTDTFFPSCLILFLLIHSSYIIKLGIALKYGLISFTALFPSQSMITSLSGNPCIFKPTKEQKQDQVLLAVKDLRNTCDSVSWLACSQHQHLDGLSTAHLLNVSSIGILYFQSLHMRKVILKGTPFVHIYLNILFLSSPCQMYCQADLTVKVPFVSSIQQG